MRRIQSLILGVLLAGLASTATAVDVAQKPVFLNPPDPRIMLVMSRDHELSKKAYNDYSDLNGDGVLETTYTDTIDYYGYFDTKKCYIYSTTDNRFNPAALATGANLHHCTSQWSGNFLNWVSMTRMDVLRKTLYGGLRSSDTGSSTVAGITELERTMLPNDVHAFAKVFAPAGGATEVGRYTPYGTETALTFCNVTEATVVSQAIPVPSSTATTPKILVASSTSPSTIFPLWAMTERRQCVLGGGNADRPTAVLATLTARVAVCVASLLEDNCTLYGVNRKPTGLLQKYGEKEALARVQFSLLTGSYSKNKSGGVLRKNASWLTNNVSTTNNEINPATGQFVNQTTTDAGIINTINRIKIAGWDFAGAGVHQYTCGTPGILTFNDGECVDWGNPISEMYLESMRYFAGKTAATAAFDSTTAEQTHIPSLPKVAWVDPLPAGEWCSLSNTVVLSTGLNSFDTNQLTTDVPTGINAVALTNTVGTLESITGSYMVGSSDGGATSDGQCTGKTVTNFSDVQGVCPEVPTLQGGYHLAGLAYSNQTVDLRPGYQTLRNARWGTGSPSPKPNFAARQPMATYTVALAESLPRLAIPVASVAGGSSITFLPACQANTLASAPNTVASPGWRACSLTDLRFTSLTTNVSGQPISGTLVAAWEDSTWGNDYDMDGVQVINFCVGTACSPALASNQIGLSTQVTRTAAGHAMRFGYTVTGSITDGTSFPVLIPGGSNVTTGTPAAPTVTSYTLGLSAAKQLESPLWYAAKYGRADWDTTGGGVSGDQPDLVPDNYFKVTNPAKLFDALGKVFDEAATADASASAIASNSTRLSTDTHVYQALFQSPKWTGELKALPLSATGVAGAASWEASAGIPAAASRKILTWNGQAWNSTTGTGTDFTWAAITGPAATLGTQQNLLGSANVLDYIRGDQSNEKPTGIYRKRSSRLGDIVNSDPHYVAAENYGYDQPGSFLTLQADKDIYTTFRTVTKVARKKMLYVGVNDGMLHAINAANTTASGGGTELFTYVPNAVIPNLKNLADPNYQHLFYVDGSANSGDALLPALGGWRTILIGALGAGGKAVFALDITDPVAFSATDVLWEFTDATDLGQIMGRAHIARMNDGNWYAVFGNGYNSTSQKAVLFLVPLDKTLPVRKIDTLVGTDNGMSEVALLDTNGDRIIDVIYAGDLKGNVWRFDVSASNAGTWGSAYQAAGNPSPLFKAAISTVDQPITGALEIGAPPAGVSGYMIYFGTGRYLGNTDVGTVTTQTAYGILDSGTRITTGRTALVAQTFVYEGPRTSTDPTQIRVASSNAVAYTGAGAKRGWYLDLLTPNPVSPAPPSPGQLGERVVSVPLLRNGRAIFTSIVPSADPCQQGGYSWISELDSLTGGRLSYSVFDFNNDDLFNNIDYANFAGSTNPVTSKKLGNEGLMKAPTVIEAGEKEFKVGSGTAGGIVVIKEKGRTGNPRTSWRQLFGL